jgi:hypothetical protein
LKSFFLIKVNICNIFQNFEVCTNSFIQLTYRFFSLKVSVFFVNSARTTMKAFFLMFYLLYVSLTVIMYISLFISNRRSCALQKGTARPHNVESLLNPVHDATGTFVFPQNGVRSRLISTPSPNDVTVLYKLQQETGYIARGYLNPNKFLVLPSLPHIHKHTHARTPEYLLQNWKFHRKLVFSLLYNAVQANSTTFLVFSLP